MIVILYILIIIFIIDFIKKNFKYKSVKQPWAIPILGNLPQLGSSPHEALKDLSRSLSTKVYGLWFGDIYTVVVSDLEVLREIFVNNFDNFVERPKLPSFAAASSDFRGIVVGNEEYWRIAKKKIANTFQRIKLSQHAYNMINEESVNFINSFKEAAESGQSIRPRRLCQRFSVNVILRYVFNRHVSYDINNRSEVIGDDKNLLELIHAIDDFMKMVASGNVLDYIRIAHPIYKKYLESNGPHVKITKMIKDIYEEHERTIDLDNPRDLIDNLIIEAKGPDSHPVDALQNVLIGFDFFIGGSDTSSNTLEWFILMMANYPEVQEKCFAELKSVCSMNEDQVKLSGRPSTTYFNATIKEVMRIHSVAPLSLPREAKNDITLSDGTFIPAQTQIIMNIGSVLTDPDYFDKPNEFKPERFIETPNNQYFIPFGIGNRQCAGSQLSLDEIYISAANMLVNYKIKTIIDGKNISEEEKFSLTIHPKEQYSIYVEKR